MRSPCCSVGYGGENPDLTWHIHWLPKGYAITAADRFVCAFAEPEDGSWEGYGLAAGKRPPLIEAVCAAIETFYRLNPNEPPPGRLEKYAAEIIAGARGD
jgi:hypothetical protein